MVSQPVLRDLLLKAGEVVGFTISKGQITVAKWASVYKTVVGG